MKATKTKKATALNTKIKRLNAKYRKATPAQRRVMIAKDALEQIKSGRFDPSLGVFTCVMKGNGDTPDHDEPLQPILHKPATRCECCGVGAVFLSYVRLNNIATERLGHDFGDIRNATDWPFENLRLIEIAFEQGKGTMTAGSDNDFLAQSFGDNRLGDENAARTRLEAILNNIIKSKDGLFNP